MSMRFGVLGTGVWADICHAPLIASHPDVDLIGIWGRDEHKVAEMAIRHGVAAETSLDALLDKVDAVAISVAPAAQPDLACRAAEAGCHLILEKPLALNTDDAARVVAAVEKAQVQTVTYFSFLYAEPGATWLRESVFPKEWEGAHCAFTASVFAAGSPFKDSQWRQGRGTGLWDVGPHALSVLLPALGNAARVSAAQGIGETVALAIEHVDGGLSTSTLSATVPEAAEQLSFDFWGATGIVRYPEESGFGEASFHACVSDLIHAVNGSTTQCDVRFTAEVVSVLADAQASLPRSGESF